ncbi:hypothetical protein BGZ83_000420 [Gryganskiella cystojenkinii]|nr:hypothetical protein BGZ83_000420 [Gryganskiella cystojenkinii]
MLVNPAQSHFKLDRFDHTPAGSFDSLASLQPKAGYGVRKSPGSYHRRSVSCLAVASHHEHYDHPSYYAASSGRYYDTIDISEGSASPVHHTRHVQRKSEGAISMAQLQRSLSNAGLVNVSSTATTAAVNPSGSHQKKDGDYTMVSVPSGPLSGKLVKVNIASPSSTPRRSLLSDLLNSQGTPTRLEQNANRRRMLKSMRRYSVDASEMNFMVGPSTRVSPMTSIPSEDDAASSSSSTSSSPMLIESRQTGFSATPTVRYLRNPCHAAIKTRLQPSAFRGTLQRRGADENGERPDYFGGDDRVW